jgi:hypothetical protein
MKSASFKAALQALGESSVGTLALNKRRLEVLLADPERHDGAVCAVRRAFSAQRDAQSAALADSERAKLADAVRGLKDAAAERNSSLALSVLLATKLARGEALEEPDAAYEAYGEGHVWRSFVSEHTAPLAAILEVLRGVGCCRDEEVCFADEVLACNVVLVDLAITHVQLRALLPHACDAAAGAKSADAFASYDLEDVDLAWRGAGSRSTNYFSKASSAENAPAGVDLSSRQLAMCCVPRRRRRRQTTGRGLVSRRWRCCPSPSSARAQSWMPCSLRCRAAVMTQHSRGASSGGTHVRLHTPRRTSV